MDSRRLFHTAVALSILTALAWAPAAKGEAAGATVRQSQQGMIDAGDEHTCAVLDSGAVRCFGGNVAGKLGLGSTSEPSVGDDEHPESLPPVDLGTGRSARAIATGSDHSCALLDDASIRCWGQGINGRLGRGDTATIGDGETPGSVPALPSPPGLKPRAITAGRAHTCALFDDGSVRCWGANNQGQLGFGGGDWGNDPGESPATATPVDFGPGRSARAVSAGSNATCAILDDGAVRCWGLLQGVTSTTPVPVGLGVGRTARAISVANPASAPHVCVLLDNGAVRCWGPNGGGQLGNGDTTSVYIADAATSGPVDLGVGRTAVAIAAGPLTTCAILDDGTGRCWGENVGSYGNASATVIGDNEPVSAGAVSVFSPQTTPLTVVVGAQYSCWLLTTSRLHCAGAKNQGQTGRGTLTGSHDTLTVPVKLGEPLVRLRADVSLSAAADNRSPRVGDSVAVTITAANSGPDGTTGLVIGTSLPAGLVLQSATPSTGTFDSDAGVWQPGPLAPGAATTLVLRVRASAEGSLAVGSSVTALGVFDSDSVAGTLAGEDDEASTTLQVGPALPAAGGGGGGAGAGGGGGGGAGGGGGVAAPGDTTAPSVTLTVPRSTTLANLKKGLKATAQPNEAARLDFELLGKPKSVRLAAAGDLVLSSRALGIAAGSRAATLKPSAKLLGKPKKAFSLRVRVTATDAAGNQREVVRTVKVTVPKPKRR